MSARFFTALVYRYGIEPAFEAGDILQGRKVAVHADEGFLCRLHGQVVVHEKFIAVIVNPPVPELYQPVSCLFVSVTGLLYQRIGMHDAIRPALVSHERVAVSRLR